jgi:hypothetical protein
LAISLFAAALRSLHKQAKKEVLAEGQKHSATKLLRQIHF